MCIYKTKILNAIKTDTGIVSVMEGEIFKKKKSKELCVIMQVIVLAQ